MTGKHPQLFPQGTPIEYIAAFTGDAYVLSHRVAGLTNGSTESIYLHWPSTASGRVAATSIQSTGTGDGEVQLLSDVTVTSAGTSLTPHTVAIGTGVTATATAQLNPTVSGGTTILDTVQPGGTKSVGGGGSSTVPSLTLQSGHNLLWKITNTSGGNNTYSVTIIFTETPISPP